MATLNFSHMGLACKNPIKIETFYTKHFGFIRARVYAPGPDQVVMIKAGNVSLELFKTNKDRPLDPPKEAGYEFPGWRHISFSVEDLESKLKEMGDDAKITLGPIDMSNFIPGMRVCWLADPEGNILELNQGYVDEENPPPLE